MSDAIVQITDRARAVLAIGEELDAVEDAIAAECRRHHRAMQALSAKQAALESAILKLSQGQP